MVSYAVIGRAIRVLSSNSVCKAKRGSATVARVGRAA
jgi:hypothetical protein